MTDRLGGHGSLSAAPGWVPIAKAALTRSRSLGWLARTRGQGEGRAGRLRILFYHRVSDERDPLAVGVDRFRRQMELLAREGYRVTGVEEAVTLIESGDRPGRLIALSFDDGYLDVVENALPILERHGFAATVFVTTGVLDGLASFSWYRRQPPLVSWEQVVALDRGRTLRFEAHTVTHPNLLSLSDAELRREVAGSKTELEARLARPVRVFCYPAGLLGERERRAVFDAGFRLAVTCEPGVNSGRGDPLLLHRTAVDCFDSLLDFRAKLAGAHDASPALRNLYRQARYGAGATGPRSFSSDR